MGDTDFRELLIDLIGYASIVSAAIFGLIGLFTEYKKDGKITLWGRLAAGGIGVSAVFAMTSAVLQKQLNTEQQQTARESAANQQAQQRRQFNAQLGQLTGLNHKMSGVNKANGLLLGRMEKSLEGQQRSLLLTTALGRKQDVHTARMLRTMWNDANRITSSSLFLMTNYECPVRPGAELPSLFDENTIATVGFSTRAELRTLKHPLNTLKGDNLLSTDVGALPQKIAHLPGTNSNDEMHLMIFGPFILENADVLTDPENWRGAGVDAFLYAPLPVPLAQLRSALDSDFLSVQTLDATYTVPEDMRKLVAAVLPCNGEAELLVNGREVMDAHVPVIVFSGEGSELLYVAMKIPAQIADPKAFPTFEAAGAR